MTTNLTNRKWGKSKREKNRWYVVTTESAETLPRGCLIAASFEMGFQDTGNSNPPPSGAQFFVVNNHDKRTITTTRERFPDSIPIHDAHKKRVPARNRHRVGKSINSRCDQQAAFYRVESAMDIAADLPPGCGVDEAGVRATH